MAREFTPPKNLAKAVLTLKTEEEALSFLSDLLSEREIVSIEQRILIAEMLQNKNSYAVIVQKTGAGSTTVSKVNERLRAGCGYQTVLRRLAEQGGAGLQGG